MDPDVRRRLRLAVTAWTDAGGPIDDLEDRLSAEGLTLAAAPQHHDAVDAWLHAHRDAHPVLSSGWRAVQDLIEDYHRRSRAGIALLDPMPGPAPGGGART
ncbi:hypothetical protein [Bailinhaonella thermotolerans]|uniref:Uncharacterized protein n=1 Tax=Bailinhaonella thermotolerans TaxID=1070861 RepID=A0A3A4AJN3_9ACTN|nr:hypothetical protein [Bailinhaonella thermotolerans]RJL21081.1 hypothetical protein D5H75_38360 [Bailinhaonella thermotolerans]